MLEGAFGSVQLLEDSTQRHKVNPGAGYLGNPEIL